MPGRGFLLESWASLLFTALMLAIAQGSATAQPAPSLLDRAPPLPLDGPATPLTAPVTITRTGWGPFRQLCVASAVLRSDGAAVPARAPGCLRFAEARHDAAAGLWHLRLASESARAGAGFAATRTDDGRIGELALVVPPDLQPPPAAQREAMLADLRAALEAAGLTRRELAQGGRFAVPLPPGLATQGVTMLRAALECSVEGAARLAGRPVLTARCDGRAESAPADRTRRILRLAGRFAVDVETGLFLAQGYATQLDLVQADPSGGAPRPAGSMVMLTRTRLL